jgi:tol-pal system protein YbgF
MSTASKQMIFAPTRGPRRPWRLALLALALAGPGCASTSPAARSEADNARALERLRAENAGQVRKMEELANQVFILTSELDNRRAVAPLAAVAPPPLALPEVKLAPGERVPGPEAGSDPASLVDVADVEYAGAAADRGTAKRPVLKLWGPGADDGVSSAETSLANDDQGADLGRDLGSNESLSARDRAGDAGPAMRERRRSALSRRPPHPSPKPAPITAAVEPPPARSLGKLALAAGPGGHASVSRLPAPGPTGSNGAADNALYQAALGQLRAGHHDEAVAGLRAFVAAHPQHDLADNAQYWLGECFYDRKDFSTALREFRRVVEVFPNGNKVPDALLKLGLSYLALGSARPGREALADLVRRFPQHPTAALAQARLAELPKEVR